MSDEQAEAPEQTAEAADVKTEQSPKTADNLIPRARLNEVLGERDTLRAELDSLRKQLQGLEPYKEQVTTLQAQLDQVRALSQAGIVDDEGQAVAGMLYDRLAEKPEGGIVGWLQGLTDPEKAPKPLRPYLTQGQPQAAPQGAATPDLNASAVAAVDGRLSPEALADANRRAMRGDKDAHEAIRRHMRARCYL